MKRVPPKVIVIGLDSVPPALAFERHLHRMPALRALMENGIYGPLRSTDPPITVPAWVTMTTGADPGVLGIYGFRRRTPGARKVSLTSPADLRHPRVWDLLEDRGESSIVVSVPLTYPPKPSSLTQMTSGFLTPSRESPWASSPELKREIEDRFGPYIIDAEDYRTYDKRGLLERCEALTRQHFAIFRHLIETRPSPFAMMVDLGPDRLHHGMLRSVLPSHPGWNPDDPMIPACDDYYTLLDAEIAATVELADDDTLVMVVSDHGVRPLVGSVCVNEILYEAGLLSLREYPMSPTPLTRCAVDWSRTKAWAEGGYIARIYLNLSGREPNGIVDSSEKNALLNTIGKLMGSLQTDDHGRISAEAFTPEDLYGRPTGYPPDLTVYFDDLSYRSAGTLGHRSRTIPVNDTGPDDANHDRHGILVAAGGPIPNLGRIEGLRIEDVFRTSIAALGMDPPPESGGKSLFSD